MRLLETIREIILPHPQIEYLEVFRSALGPRQNMVAFSEEIKRNTAFAQQQHIKVKWYRGFIGAGLLIGNPKTHNGWAHIHTVFPFIEPGHRMAIRVERYEHEEDFNRIWGLYESLSAGSEEPSA